MFLNIWLDSRERKSPGESIEDSVDIDVCRIAVVTGFDSSESLAGDPQPLQPREK